MHIVGIGNELAIYGNRSKGVKPFAAQQNQIGCQHLTINRELAHIFVIGVGQGECGILIVPVKRILHPARVKQIGIDGAGDAGIQPFRIVNLPHFPWAV